MGFKVVILESAEQDLKEIRAYIVKKFSDDTWRNSYAKIQEAIRNLQKLPQAGSVPEEIEKLNLTQYREILYCMNRVIYEVRQDVIYIHIVVDARKNINNLLTHRLLRVNTYDFRRESK